jgi:hypothetical protein
MQNLQQTGQDNQERTANESKNQDNTEGNVDNTKPIIDKKENSNKKYLLIIAISLVLIFFVLIGYLAYFIFLKDNNKDNGKSETSETTSQISSSSSLISSSSTTSTISTTTSSEAPDPYDGWLTYTNNLLGYTLKYPPSYTLNDSNEECVYFNKNVVGLNIGRGYTEEDFGCFRTGVGAYEIEYTPRSYSVRGENYTIQEWYEKHDCTDSGYGNVYGRLMLGKI